MDPSLHSDVYDTGAACCHQIGGEWAGTRRSRAGCRGRAPAGVEGAKPLELRKRVTPARLALCEPCPRVAPSVPRAPRNHAQASRARTLKGKNKKNRENGFRKGRKGLRGCRAEPCRDPGAAPLAGCRGRATARRRPPRYSVTSSFAARPMKVHSLIWAVTASYSLSKDWRMTVKSASFLTLRR